LSERERQQQQKNRREKKHQDCFNTTNTSQKSGLARLERGRICKNPAGVRQPANRARKPEGSHMKLLRGDSDLEGKPGHKTAAKEPRTESGTGKPTSNKREEERYLWIGGTTV